jgi:hypothetical protein
MYLMYVDESGDTGLIGSPTRYFILTGLVLHELRWQSTLDAMVAFRRELRGRFGLKLREEVHAVRMIRSSGDLSRIAKHHRLEILKLHAAFLGSLPDVSLISIVVDKQGKASAYDVFENAWTALIQRFENTVSHSNFPGPKNADDRGMLLCDHTDDKKLTSLLRRLRAYNPIANQQKFGPGYRNLVLKTIVEDPSFRDSKDSLFVQAVDVSAYLQLQQLSPTAYFRQKGAKNYFSRLYPICCKFASLKDPNGIVRL